jgi:predicted N-acetyltransferase YhbS
VKIDYKIVIIKPEDWEAHIAQVVSVRVSAFEKWNGLKSQENQEKEARLWFRKWSERHNPALFVAKRDNEIIGYLIADERRKQEYYISHIGVREDLKRKGIGCSLIRKYEEKAKAGGYRALTTTTYNRFKGILILLLQEGFYIQGVTWVEGATEPRISLRKELK